jgi:hypothetical protein
MMTLDKKEVAWPNMDSNKETRNIINASENHSTLLELLHTIQRNLSYIYITPHSINQIEAPSFGDIIGLGLDYETNGFEQFSTYYNAGVVLFDRFTFLDRVTIR